MKNMMFRSKNDVTINTYQGQVTLSDTQRWHMSIYVNTPEQIIEMNYEFSEVNDNEEMMERHLDLYSNETNSSFNDNNMLFIN